MAWLETSPAVGSFAHIFGKEFDMLFMVVVQLHPGTKAAAMESFEFRGPNRHPGIAFRGAWIGAHDDSLFVLVEASDSARVESAIAAWGDVGVSEIHSVINVEDF
jgi:hypothetical protein